jgi:hypothetical protein
MATDRTKAIDALLAETEVAHGAFETTELKGVYDEEWARWYAAYAVDHGIAEQLGHDIAADQLAGFLASSYTQFAQADPKPDEPWTAYIARRIVDEL